MTEQTPSDDLLRSLKDQARATWSAGNYDAVAEGIWEVGAAIVDGVGIRPGDEVLDVACGTGNAAIRAALAGGTVTGLDLTPELFGAARRRAAEAQAEVRWIEGDAEALPFEDESFDVVISTFGVMFAPRHQVAAAEMARVLRAGGRIGLATWTPDGTVGRLFLTVSAHLPPPPDIASPPIRWGVEAHVEELFGRQGIELAFERRRLALDPDIDHAEAVEFYLASFGPLIRARALLEPQGRWQAAEAEIRPAIENMLADPPEYLAITGAKAGDPFRIRA